MVVCSVVPATSLSPRVMASEAERELPHATDGTSAEEVPDTAGHPTSKELDEDSAQGDFPEGGLRAWIVAASASGILFCTFGYLNAFG